MTLLCMQILELQMSKWEVIWPKFEINKKFLRCLFVSYDELTFFGAGIIFLILAHSANKMWIIQETNALELWNKLHFEEKKRRVYTVFKIFSIYICWINI